MWHPPITGRTQGASLMAAIPMPELRSEVNEAISDAMLPSEVNEVISDATLPSEVKKAISLPVPEPMSMLMSVLESMPKFMSFSQPS